MVEPVVPCLTKRLSPEKRQRLKERYRKMKKYGLRAGFAGITGVGLLGVAKDIAQEQAFFHGKRYLGLILFGCGFTSFSAGLTLATNGAKYAKACFSVCAAGWRASHNIAEAPLILWDYVLFGEYVPSCGEADYDIFSPNVTDVFGSFFED